MRYAKFEVVTRQILKFPWVVKNIANLCQTNFMKLKFCVGTCDHEIMYVILNKISGASLKQQHMTMR